MNNLLYNNATLAQGNPPRRPKIYRHRPSQLLDVYTAEEIRELGDRYRFSLDAILYEEYVRSIGVRNSNPSELTRAVISVHFLCFPCRLTFSPF